MQPVEGYTQTLQYLLPDVGEVVNHLHRLVNDVAILLLRVTDQLLELGEVVLHVVCNMRSADLGEEALG